MSRSLAYQCLELVQHIVQSQTYKLVTNTIQYPEKWFFTFLASSQLLQLKDNGFQIFWKCVGFAIAYVRHEYNLWVHGRLESLGKRKDKLIVSNRPRNHEDHRSLCKMFPSCAQHPFLASLCYRCPEMQHDIYKHLHMVQGTIFTLWPGATNCRGGLAGGGVPQRQDMLLTARVRGPCQLPGMW
jgi:hypothetical protein